MFSYRVFRQEDILLAICDIDILGKTFRNGGIEITVSDFYRGMECGEEQAIELAQGATIINAVGNKIIRLLVDKGIVDEPAVLKIGGVMHAQVVSVSR